MIKKILKIIRKDEYPLFFRYIATVLGGVTVYIVAKVIETWWKT